MNYEKYKLLTKDQKEEYNWKFKEPVFQKFVIESKYHVMILIMQMVCFTLYLWFQRVGFMNESYTMVGLLPALLQAYWVYVIIIVSGTLFFTIKYAIDYRNFLLRCKR